MAKCTCQQEGTVRIPNADCDVHGEDLTIGPQRIAPGEQTPGDDASKQSNPKDALAAVQGRVPLHLFPQTAVVAGSMAMWEGAVKYGQYNYRAVGVRASVYAAALLRHMFGWLNGEDIDPKSGLLHTWKALACVAILIDAEECGVLIDDRPYPGPVAEMLERLQPLVKEIEERYVDDYDPHQYTIADARGEERDD